MPIKAIKKHRFKDLVILAGPSGAGKSFVVRKLRKGKLHNLFEYTNIQPTSSFKFIHLGELKHEQHYITDATVLHIDIRTMIRNPENIFKRIDFDNSNISVITLCIRQDKALKRIYKRTIIGMIKNWRHPSIGMSLLKKAINKRELFLIEKHFPTQCINWLSVLESTNIKSHYLINSNQKSIKEIEPFCHSKAMEYFGLKA